MTISLEHLDKLIEAVEAGAIPGADTHGRYLAFINLWDECGLSRVHGQDGHIAFHGSLDAAHRLHEALLPGWAWEVNGTMISQGFSAYLWRASGDGTNSGHAEASNPARSWLLAILRAVKAQGERG